MLIYIAWTILIFTAIQFIISFVNILFSEDMNVNVIHSNSLVSILVPARNEEDNIEKLINNVINQRHHNFELIICDDQSEDRTSEIVRQYIKKDYRIKLINTKELPKGWLGKNYACHLLSKQAKGTYYLFLDADVTIRDNIISQAVSYSQKHNLGLISIFPRQITHKWGEKITVPVMNYILLSLLPLILVRKTKYPSLSAANGQFMFFSANVYNKFEPHKKVRKNKVEDIAIASLLKNENINISCLSGTDKVSCRMYNSYEEAINGFSKNVSAFFGNSYILAVLFWFISTFGIIIIAIAFNSSTIILFIFLHIMIRFMVSSQSKQNIVENLLLVIPQQLSLGIFIYKSIINVRGKQFKWKGRELL